MSDDPLSSGFASHAATFDDAGPLALPADPQVAACMERWLRASTNARSADTCLFAKLIAERDVRDELALLGLQSRDWDALLARHFSGASAFGLPVALNDAHCPVIAIAATSPVQVNNDHTDFLHSLHALLLGYASADVNPHNARDLATIIAPPGPAPGCPGCEDFGFCFPL